MSDDNAGDFLSRVVTDDIKLRAISVFAESCPNTFEGDTEDTLGEGIGMVLSVGILYGMLLQREGISMPEDALVGVQSMFPELAEALVSLKTS